MKRGSCVKMQGSAVGQSVTISARASIQPALILGKSTSPKPQFLSASQPLQLSSDPPSLFAKLTSSLRQSRSRPRWHVEISGDSDAVIDGKSALSSSERRRRTRDNMGPRHPASETAGERAQAHDADDTPLPLDNDEKPSSDAAKPSDSIKKQNVIRCVHSLSPAYILFACRLPPVLTLVSPLGALQLCPTLHTPFAPVANAWSPILGPTPTHLP